MTEWEWFKLLVGIVLPLLVAHGIWATTTILRLRHTMENGLKSTVGDLDAWRYGKPPYDTDGRTLDVESRCRHDAKNLDQQMIDKVAGEMKLERRRLPKRGA